MISHGAYATGLLINCRVRWSSEHGWCPIECRTSGKHTLGCNKSMTYVNQYPWRIHGAAIYMMVTWIPSIYPSHVSIYTSTMDPMGIRYKIGMFWKMWRLAPWNHARCDQYPTHLRSRSRGNVVSYNAAISACQKKGRWEAVPRNWNHRRYGSWEVRPWLIMKWDLYYLI